MKPIFEIETYPKWSYLDFIQQTIIYVHINLLLKNKLISRNIGQFFCEIHFIIHNNVGSQ